jgi:membrane protein insertase Oxa1/YidC/SpoIIIJ
MLKNN